MLNQTPQRFKQRVRHTELVRSSHLLAPPVGATSRDRNPSIQATSVEPQRHNLKSAQPHHYSSGKKPRKIAAKQRSPPNIRLITAVFGSRLHKKLKNYISLLLSLNSTLNISYRAPLSRQYSVYIGKGNNSKLIKSLFAMRYWWTVVKNPQQCGTNLCWTQLSRQIHTERLNALEQTSSDSRRRPIDFTCNHIPGHEELTNKKNLFNNLRLMLGEQCFDIVPLTFHLPCPISEEAFSQIEEAHAKLISGKHSRVLWIVKPGENSNRGCGITVCRKVAEIKQWVSAESQAKPNRSFIVQHYVSPFLFHRRKFDIRMLALIVASPQIAVYWCPTGYIRTSSYQFSRKDCSNKFIHLTNDAVQKKSQSYSRFEKGNKVSFEEFQNYLQSFHSKKNISFHEQIVPCMKEMIIQSVKAVQSKLNRSKAAHCFEIIGYDFLIDQDFKPWLIEANTNPCLQTGCPLLDEIIPNFLEGAIKIAVDTVFRPPKISEWPMSYISACSEKLTEPSKLELIYAAQFKFSK